MYLLLFLGTSNNNSKVEESGSSAPFVTLEPPFTDNDYNFSLDKDEGFSDLFDFCF